MRRAPKAPALVPDLRGRSLLIFDDGLRHCDGHWYEYVRSVVDMHRERGAGVTIVAHTEFAAFDRFDHEEVDVRPILSQSIWTGQGFGRGPISETVALFKLARYKAKVLEKELAARPVDLVFVPNATIYDALAWAILRVRRSAARGTRAALLFRFSVPGVKPDLSERIARKFAVWRVIFAALRGAVRRDQVVLLTDSARLADQYRAVGRVELTVVPSARILPPKPEGPQSRNGHNPTFALLGYARWERGVDLFQDAIARLRESGDASGLRFLIQWHVDVSRPDGSRVEKSELLLADGRVRFIDRSMSSEEYEAIFSEIDCMVLPYRREVYHSGISGVAVEAACAGIPIICTGDTWTSDFMHKMGAGIDVPEGDPAALADAVRSMAAHIDDYTERARAQSVKARAANGAEPFLRALWGSPVPAPGACN